MPAVYQPDREYSTRYIVYSNIIHFGSIFAQILRYLDENFILSLGSDSSRYFLCFLKIAKINWDTPEKITVASNLKIMLNIKIFAMTLIGNTPENASTKQTAVYRISPMIEENVSLTK